MDEGLWTETLGHDARRVLILDDDPTGTQTVADVEVILHPSLDAYRRFFAGNNRAVYVLTNSRALPRDRAVTLIEGIRDEVCQAAQESGQSVAFLLRGDSTLRGHVFAEIDALAAADSVVLFVPAFPEGGRTTVGGVHYITIDGRTVPVAHTEFAQDSTFGYVSERLVDWVAEVGDGRGAVSLSLAEQRSQGAEAIERALRSAAPGTVLLPDAETHDDLRAVALGLLRAEARGRSVVVRSASTFAAIRAGLQGRSIDRVDVPGRGRVLLVCGSHTAGASAQLARLYGRSRLTPAIVPSDRCGTASRGACIQEMVERVSDDLRRHNFAILTSERERRREHGDLETGAMVMKTLTEIVHQVVDETDAVIAKGGITSAEVAREGLGANRARVCGQLEPGVSLWDVVLADGRALPYSVVPGNVGGDDTLAAVAGKLGVSLQHPGAADGDSKQ